MPKQPIKLFNKATNIQYKESLRSQQEYNDPERIKNRDTNLKILKDKSNDKELISSHSDKPVSIIELLFETYLQTVFDESYDPLLLKYHPKKHKKKFMNKVISFNLIYACQFIYREELNKIIKNYYKIFLAKKLRDIEIFENSPNYN